MLMDADHTSRVQAVISGMWVLLGFRRLVYWRIDL